MLLPNHLLLKLIMTPLIIAAATLVARHWGENIGGLMVGLPLTSGPVSIFFAIEQGHNFAAHAALGSMLGLIPVAVFCTGYVLVSRRLPWYLTAAASISFYLASVWGMSLISPGLWLTTFLVPAGLTLALLVIGRTSKETVHLSAPWWDLPLRMVIASTLLILITTGAASLGSKWSGLLSPFPIFTFVMATFTHHQGGAPAARRLIRGVVTGLFAYLAFFLVVTLLVERASLLIVYPLAAAAALVVNGLSLARLVHKSPSTNPAA